MLIKLALNVGPAPIKATAMPGQMLEHINACSQVPSRLHLWCSQQVGRRKESAGREAAGGPGGASDSETCGPGSTPLCPELWCGAARRWARGPPDASEAVDAFVTCGTVGFQPRWQTLKTLTFPVSLRVTSCSDLFLIQ